jgi:hypothetical protein
LWSRPDVVRPAFRPHLKRANPDGLLHGYFVYTIGICNAFVQL